ncbi:MAG: hypothetical protein V5A84_05235, partial [Planctomycetota bacterium]
RNFLRAVTGWYLRRHGQPDPKGNSDGDYKYSDNYKNRLVELEENLSGTWNTFAEYRYDAKGRRIVKTVFTSGG